ncbi:MAG: LLM class flavin-dependent oxidoreductase [Acidimicrobiia bacterium]|nr:LLM class flavin-dependent oxidoreductase [Acidimicrobiia bacterium]
MRRVTAPRRWAVLAPHRPASGIAAQARAAEDAGFEGCFSVQLHSSPFVPLGVASAVTSRLSLATGIALTFTRSPFETAIEALDLDRASEGRFTLGLGASVRTWHTGAHGVAYDPPVARLAEAIQVIRMVTTGFAATPGRPGTAERRFDGRHYQVDFSGLELRAPLRHRLPIWVAALRSPLCQVAGRWADGLLGHPSWSIPWARQQVEGPFAQGLAESGRERDDVDVNLWLTVAPNPDRAQAVQDAKRHVAFYASISQYFPYYEGQGFGAEARALAEAAAAGRLSPALVSDDMARAFVVCGTPGEVSSALRGLVGPGGVADSLTLRPPPVPDREAAAAYEARIAELFA